MIKLTRLNRREIALNCDLIEWAEAVPDTRVRMVSGECILVLESVEEVIERISEYRRALLSSAGLAAVVTSGWRPGRSYLRREGSGPGGREDSEPPDHQSPSCDDRDRDSDRAPGPRLRIAGGDPLEEREEEE